MNKGIKIVYCMVLVNIGILVHYMGNMYGGDDSKDIYLYSFLAFFVSGGLLCIYVKDVFDFIDDVWKKL